MPGDICTMARGCIICARCLTTHGQGQGPAGRNTGVAELAGVIREYQPSLSDTGGEPPAPCKLKPTHTVAALLPVL
jgi:hypothetical protein